MRFKTRDHQNYYMWLSSEYEWDIVPTPFRYVKGLAKNGELDAIEDEQGNDITKLSLVRNLIERKHYEEVLSVVLSDDDIFSLIVSNRVEDFLAKKRRNLE